jgi:hypothetical protein
VGQPGLAATVLTEPLRALNERITRRVLLAPLTPVEVTEYIRHRLDIAGGRDRVEFLPTAVTLISDLSRGLPRRVNLLCDRALEEGRIAGATQIDANMVRRAARSIAGVEPDLAPPPAAREIDIEIDRMEPVERELTLGQTPPRRGRLGRGLLGLLVLVAGILAGGAYAWTSMSREPDLPPTPTAPKLDVGRPPPKIPIPSEEEIRAGLSPKPPI